MGRYPRSDWRSLKAGVERSLLLSGAFPPSTRISGRVKFLRAGLNHGNFVFRPLADEPLPSQAGCLVLRRIRSDPSGCATAVARLQAEAQTLRALDALPRGFATPRFICFVADSDGVARAFIETAVVGWPLRFSNGGGEQSRMAIAAIGRAAASVHRLPVSHLQFLRSHADANAHRTAELSGLDADFLTHDKDAAAAIAWVRDHRPKPRRAVVLHGDWRPQNVLLDLETRRLGVIDWEYAKIGDPAYDLAIVTRGNRKLLGIAWGLRRLVGAYLEAGGAAIELTDIVIWELLLALRWLRRSLQYERDGQRGGQPSANYRNLLRAILRRATE